MISFNSIKTKLTIPYILLAAFLLVFAGINYYFINTRLSEIMESRMLVNSIRDSVNSVGQQTQTGILLQDSDNFIEVANLSLQTIDLIAELSKTNPVYGNMIMDDYIDYYVSMVAVESLFNENRMEEGTARLAQAYASQEEVNHSLAVVLTEIRGGQQALTNLINVLMVAMLLLTGFLILIVVSVVMPRFILRPVQKISDLTKVLAQGDFTVKAEIASQDEIGQMAGNLNQTIEALSNTLTRVTESSDNVSHASAEISSGNQDLSQRTEEQASSLEEISSTVEEITSSLEASSANAVEADNLSKGTLNSVRKGEEVVSELQGAMGEITRGSQEISEIISTVNDIAFQTNLLALNAAVEAARAGEQGRGFAVVAAEVRNLAGRSADSAKEIEKLIKDSIVRVDKGNSLMSDTEKMLQEIVNNTQKTSDVVGEIAASLKEQTTAAADIRTAIEELNQVTQQNASLVEEIASSSENMNAEATDLSNQVGFFKLASSGQTKKGSNSARKAMAAPAPKAKAKPVIEKDDFDFDESDFDKF